jgi:hypothetical protein
MSKVTRKEWYRRVNEAWPSKVPPLTEAEALRAAKRLFRFAMGYTFRGPVKVTSGRRYTWVRRGVLYVNPEQGWHSLVHLISHYCHDRSVGAEDQGHNAKHARAELRMIKEVIKRGWLEGKLKDKPKAERPVAAIDERAVRLAHTDAAIERWERKAKRAANALKKLRRRRAAQARRLITLDSKTGAA